MIRETDSNWYIAESEEGRKTHDKIMIIIIPFRQKNIWYKTDYVYCTRSCIHYIKCFFIFFFIVFACTRGYTLKLAAVLTASLRSRSKNESYKSVFYSGVSDQFFGSVKPQHWNKFWVHIRFISIRFDQDGLIDR